MRSSTKGSGALKGLALAAEEIVRRARTPAVAVDREDCILAWSPQLEDLVGFAPRRGAPLLAELDLRDAYGNVLAPRHYQVWEMIARGEPIHSFQLQVTRKNEDPLRVDVSTVVVLDGEPGAYQLVYFFKAIQRRRRADEAIDRLLTEGDLREATGAPKAAREEARSRLTARQLEVLALLGEGLSNREMAEDLGVSLHTVRSHVEEILKRTGSRAKAEAVAWAARHSLI